MSHTDLSFHDLISSNDAYIRAVQHRKITVDTLGLKKVEFKFAYDPRQRKKGLAAVIPEFDQAEFLTKAGVLQPPIPGGELEGPSDFQLYSRAKSRSHDSGDGHRESEKKHTFRKKYNHDEESKDQIPKSRDPPRLNPEGIPVYMEMSYRERRYIEEQMKLADERKRDEEKRKKLGTKFEMRTKDGKKLVYDDRGFRITEEEYMRQQEERKRKKQPPPKSQGPVFTGKILHDTSKHVERMRQAAYFERNPKPRKWTPGALPATAVDVKVRPGSAGFGTRVGGPAAGSGGRVRLGTMGRSVSTTGLIHNLRDKYAPPKVLPAHLVQQWPEYRLLGPGDIMITIEHCCNCHEHDIDTHHREEVYIERARQVKAALVTTAKQFGLRCYALLKPIQHEDPLALSQSRSAGQLNAILSRATAGGGGATAPFSPTRPHSAGGGGSGTAGLETALGSPLSNINYFGNRLGAFEVQIAIKPLPVQPTATTAASGEVGSHNLQQQGERQQGEMEVKLLYSKLMSGRWPRIALLQALLDQVLEDAQFFRFRTSGTTSPLGGLSPRRELQQQKEVQQQLQQTSQQLEASQKKNKNKGVNGQPGAAAEAKKKAAAQEAAAAMAELQPEFDVRIKGASRRVYSRRASDNIHDMLQFVGTKAAPDDGSSTLSPKSLSPRPATGSGGGIGQGQGQASNVTSSVPDNEDLSDDGDDAAAAEVIAEAVVAADLPPKPALKKPASPTAAASATAASASAAVPPKLAATKKRSSTDTQLLRISSSDANEEASARRASLSGGSGSGSAHDDDNGGFGEWGGGSSTPRASSAPNSRSGTPKVLRFAPDVKSHDYSTRPLGLLRRVESDMTDITDMTEDTAGGDSTIGSSLGAPVATAVTAASSSSPGLLQSGLQLTQLSNGGKQNVVDPTVGRGVGGAEDEDEGTSGSPINRAAFLQKSYSERLFQDINAELHKGEADTDEALHIDSREDNGTGSADPIAHLMKSASDTGTGTAATAAASGGNDGGNKERRNEVANENAHGSFTFPDVDAAPGAVPVGPKESTAGDIAKAVAAATATATRSAGIAESQTENEKKSCANDDDHTAGDVREAVNRVDLKLPSPQYSDHSSPVLPSSDCSGGGAPPDQMDGDELKLDDLHHHTHAVKGGACSTALEAGNQEKSEAASQSKHQHQHHLSRSSGSGHSSINASSSHASSHSSMNSNSSRAKKRAQDRRIVHAIEAAARAAESLPAEPLRLTPKRPTKSSAGDGSTPNFSETPHTTAAAAHGRQGEEGTGDEEYQDDQFDEYKDDEGGAGGAEEQLNRTGVVSATGSAALSGPLSGPSSAAASFYTTHTVRTVQSDTETVRNVAQPLPGGLIEADATAAPSESSLQPSPSTSPVHIDPSVGGSSEAGESEGADRLEDLNDTKRSAVSIHPERLLQSPKTGRSQINNSVQALQKMLENDEHEDDGMYDVSFSTAGASGYNPLRNSLGVDLNALYRSESDDMNNGDQPTISTSQFQSKSNSNLQSPANSKLTSGSDSGLGSPKSPKSPKSPAWPDNTAGDSSTPHQTAAETKAEAAAARDELHIAHEHIELEEHDYDISSL